MKIHDLIRGLYRIGHTVPWQYVPDTPVEKLYRHHRIARTVAYVWMTSSVLMVSEFFDSLLSAGWSRRISSLISLVSLAIAGVSVIPAIICLPWTDEIEKTLVASGQPLPGGRPFGDRVPIMAMKMCFWFAAIVIVVNFLNPRR